MNKYQIIQIVRKLRRNQTKEEKLLWKHLRNRKLDGIKFLRQHPIIYENFNDNYQFFVPDFYSAEKKLVIEVDGKIHDFQKEYDENRELILKGLDLTVLRFKNEELKNIFRVLDQIRNVIKSVS